MAAALKVFARGTFTFFEITIVVFFIASLAAMAAVSCLVARRKKRASEISRCFLIVFARGHSATSFPVVRPELSRTRRHFMLVDVHLFRNFTKTETIGRCVRSELCCIRRS